MMMKAIIVDDEKLSLDLLHRLLERTGQIQVKGAYENAYEVLENIRTIMPDIVFLDIEMPEINGLELAEQINALGIDCEIVFVTAYNQYAIEAFKVNAIDYLLKPVMPDELEKTLERTVRRLEARNRTPISKVSCSSMLHVTLLGSYVVKAEGAKTPINWMTAKCAEAFAILLLKADKREISRWRLLEMLWPDKSEEKGYINLRSTLSRLNKTLREYCAEAVGLVTVSGEGINGGNASCCYPQVIASKSGYYLAADNINTDLEQLEKLAVAIDQGTQVSIDKLEEEILNIGGELLEEMDYDWCVQERDRCRTCCQLMKKQLLAQYAKDESTGAAEGLARRKSVLEALLRFDPYDEQTQREMLRLHYILGGKRNASAYYNEIRMLFQNELGIEPDQSFQQFWKSLD